MRWRKNFLLTSRNDYIVKEEFHPLSSFTLCVFCVQYNKIKFFLSLYHPLNNPSSSSAFYHHPTHSSPFLRKKIFSCRGKNYFILFYFCKLERVRGKILDGIAQRQFLSRMRKNSSRSSSKKKPFLLSEAC